MDVSTESAQFEWIGPSRLGELLSPGRARGAIADVLQALRAGTAGASERTFHGRDGAPLGLMPGFAPGHLGVKAITILPENRERGLPTIQGVAVLFASETGAPVAVVDGPALTGLRTGAIAGLATDVLAVEAAAEMVMVGAGWQAQFQIEAVLDVRPVRRVTVWNRTRAYADQLVDQLRSRVRDVELVVTDDLTEACRRADIISLATSTMRPLLDEQPLAPWCHINAMGSYRPDHRELGSTLVARAEVYADTVEGCLDEAGDLLLPISEGSLTQAAIHPLWSASVASRERLTVLKSVGSVVFDIACAARAVEQLQAPPA